jgi:hypothetical protein
MKSVEHRTAMDTKHPWMAGAHFQLPDQPTAVSAIPGTVCGVAWDDTDCHCPSRFSCVSVCQSAKLDASRRPVVHVVDLGTTTAFSPPDFFRTILHGWPGLSVDVVVTVGAHNDHASLGSQPDTVHVERWLPLQVLLPRASDQSDNAAACALGRRSARRASGSTGLQGHSDRGAARTRTSILQRGCCAPARRDPSDARAGSSRAAAGRAAGQAAAGS